MYLTSMSNKKIFNTFSCLLFLFLFNLFETPYLFAESKKIFLNDEQGNLKQNYSSLINEKYVKPGDQIFVSDSRSFIVEQFVGGGGATKVYKVIDPKNQKAYALRLPNINSDISKEFFNTYISAYDSLKKTAINIPTIHELAASNYILVDFIPHDFTLKDFNNHSKSISKEIRKEATLAFDKFVRETALFTVIGDLRDDQVAYNHEKKEWVLLDYSDEHAFAKNIDPTSSVVPNFVKLEGMNDPAPIIKEERIKYANILSKKRIQLLENALNQKIPITETELLKYVTFSSYSSDELKESILRLLINHQDDVMKVPGVNEETFFKLAKRLSLNINQCELFFNSFSSKFTSFEKFAEALVKNQTVITDLYFNPKEIHNSQAKINLREEITKILLNLKKMPVDESLYGKDTYYADNLLHEVEGLSFLHDDDKEIIRSVVTERKSQLLLNNKIKNSINIEELWEHVNQDPDNGIMELLHKKDTKSIIRLSDQVFEKYNSKRMKSSDFYAFIEALQINISSQDTPEVRTIFKYLIEKNKLDVIADITIPANASNAFLDLVIMAIKKADAKKDKHAVADILNSLIVRSLSSPNCPKNFELYKTVIDMAIKYNDPRIFKNIIDRMLIQPHLMEWPELHTYFVNKIIETKDKTLLKNFVNILPILEEKSSMSQLCKVIGEVDLQSPNWDHLQLSIKQNQSPAIEHNSCMQQIMKNLLFPVMAPNVTQ